MKLIRRILLSLIIVVAMHSCVLEERIHFNEDFSGVYEMSFAIESMDDDDTDEKGLSDDFIFEVDSIAQEIARIDGVEILSQDITNEGFNLTMNFRDIRALNMINAQGDGKKGAGRFEVRDDRFFFNMETEPSLNEENNNKDKSSEKDRQWLKHRVIITFDKKIKRLKTDGFKKVDKFTLVYDSDKITDKEKISFSIKLK